MKNAISSVVFLISITISAAGHSNENGESSLAKNFSQAHQNIHFETAGVKLEGDVPLNVIKPFSMNGFDEKNIAYSLSVITKKQTKGVYEITFEFERNGRKRLGRISTQTGKAAEISETPDDLRDTPLKFSSTVIE